MPDILDWNGVREHLEQVLPYGLDESTWQVLQRHSLPFVADELLWRVEAIARQVPAQGTIFFRSIARDGHAASRLVTEPCELCTEQTGQGIGQRCTRCIAAISLVLGFPLLLDDVGLIDAYGSIAPDQPMVSNLFEL